MVNTPSFDQHKIRQYYVEHEADILKDYFTFLKFKSVSSEPEYKKDLLDCVNWLEKYLKDMGFQTEVWPTKGHPTLFASNLKAGPDKPTLLIYNHYDVQPVDPIDEWITPPFEPIIRDGQVYARGAQDNKGQCFYTLQALKMLLKFEGQLPLNIKLCIEGEEEMGSCGLEGVLQEKKEKLKADYLAVVDVGIPAMNKPAVSLGVRGILTMDVTAECSSCDLHSGSHGGLAYNPIHALIELFGKIRDEKGRIKIPGFYDDVSVLSEEEKTLLALKFDEEEYFKLFGTIPSGGENEFSPQERVWLRPTIEVNGINGGYVGAGFKTVIPAKAIAKVSCRLVPNQDPDHIGRLVSKYLESNAPKGVKIKVSMHGGGGLAVRVKPNSKLVKCFSEAYKEVFNAPCEYILNGGSIPVVTKLAQASESEVIFVGLGLPDDQIHAPNEHFGVDRIEKGCLIIYRALQLLG